MTAIRTAGDHGTTETLTLSGTGLVLTGATASAHIKRPDGTLIVRPVTFDGTTAKFTWAAGDLNVRGSYVGEVQVTYSSGAVQTFKVDTAGQSIRWDVRDQLA